MLFVAIILAYISNVRAGDTLTNIVQTNDGIVIKKMFTGTEMLRDSFRYAEGVRPLSHSRLEALFSGEEVRLNEFSSLLVLKRKTYYQTPEIKGGLITMQNHLFEDEIPMWIVSIFWLFFLTAGFLLKRGSLLLSVLLGMFVCTLVQDLPLPDAYPDLSLAEKFNHSFSASLIMGLPLIAGFFIGTAVRRRRKKKVAIAI